MIKITKIKNGYICEGANFNLLTFTLSDMFTQLQSIYNIALPSLFTFDNLN